MGILDDAIREHLELKRRRGATDDELSRQEAEALGPARRQPATDPGYDAEVSEETEILGPGDELPPPPAGSAVGAEEGAPPPPPPEAIEPLDADEPFEPVQPADPVEALEPLEDDPGDRLPPHGDVEAIEEPAPEPSFEEPGLDEPTAIRDVPVLDEPTAAHDLPELDEPIHAEPSGDDPLAPPPEPIEAPAPAAAARPLPPLEDDALPPEPALPEPPPDDEPDELQAPPPRRGPDGEDVLEETPDFLQDTPDHDRLWFEQKPPRDFDFDD